jgi:hypothetical protein
MDSSCKTYGKSRENVDGYLDNINKYFFYKKRIPKLIYLSASGDVKSTTIQSEASSKILSLFNELNK